MQQRPPDPENFFDIVALTALPPDEAPLPECHFLPDAEPGPSTTGLRQVLGSSPFRTLVRGSEYFLYTLLPLGPRPFKQMGYKIKGGMGFGLSGVYIQRGLCHLF